MDEQEQIFWEMINFELGETLVYLKDKESVWQHLTDENKALIIQLVSHRCLLEDFANQWNANGEQLISKYHIDKFLSNLNGG